MGLCKIRMISGGYRDFGDYDLEKIPESKVHEDVYSDIFVSTWKMVMSSDTRPIDRSDPCWVIWVYSRQDVPKSHAAISNVVAVRSVRACI